MQMMATKAWLRLFLGYILIINDMQGFKIHHLIIYHKQVFHKKMSNRVFFKITFLSEYWIHSENKHINKQLTSTRVEFSDLHWLYRSYRALLHIEPESYSALLLILEQASRKNWSNLHKNFGATTKSIPSRLAENNQILTPGFLWQVTCKINQTRSIFTRLLSQLCSSNSFHGTFLFKAYAHATCLKPRFFVCEMFILALTTVFAQMFISMV